MLALTSRLVNVFSKLQELLNECVNYIKLETRRSDGVRTIENLLMTAWISCTFLKISFRISITNLFALLRRTVHCLQADLKWRFGLMGEIALSAYITTTSDSCRHRSNSSTVTYQQS